MHLLFSLLRLRVPAVGSVAFLLSFPWLHAAVPTTGTVVQWGRVPLDYKDRPREMAPVPVGLDDVVDVAVADFYSLAIKKDGTVVAWSALPSAAEPIFAISGLRNVTKLALGSDTSAALQSDGNIAFWKDLRGPMDTYRMGNAIAIAYAYAPSRNREDLTILTRNGEVFFWTPADGAGSRPRIVPGLSNVVAMANNQQGLHLALTREGVVFTYGEGGPQGTPWLTGVSLIEGGVEQTVAALTNGMVILQSRYGLTTNGPARSRLVKLAVSDYTVLGVGEDGSLTTFPAQSFADLPSTNVLHDVTAVAAYHQRALAVVNIPANTPTLSEQSGDRTGRLGGLGELQVVATGLEPINYQWIKDSVPISGEITPLLRLSALTSASVGEYTAVVCNRYGCVTSAVMRVTLSTNISPISLQVHSLSNAGEIGRAHV